MLAWDADRESRERLVNVFYAGNRAKLSKLECFNKIFAVEVSISIINDLISCDQSYKTFYALK